MVDTMMAKAKKGADAPEPGDEGKARTSVRLYPETHRQLRKIAADRGCEIPEALRQICGKLLEEEVLRIADRDLNRKSTKPGT